MALAATEGPAEAFGIPVGPGSLPESVRASLERRGRDRFCPFLMAPCPRPYPICSILEAGHAIPICPHRLLEGQTIFRSLAPSLAGPRPMLVRHVHPSRGIGALGWVLFPADHPGAWLGVYTVAPLPAPEAALAHASHDLLAHGRLRVDGYGVGFAWPACVADGRQWVRVGAAWALQWRRPVYAFVPTPLFDRIAVPAEFSGVASAPLTLVPVDLVLEADRLRLRVAPPPSPGDLPEDRGGILRAVLFRRSDWISLDLLGDAVSVDG